MIKLFRPAVFSVISFTLLTGIIFPLIITGIAQAVFPRQARGSLLENDGKVIGSSLIGQNFAAPGYFHPRPSAAGNGYDGASSGGTNLGPTSAKLINGIHKQTPDGKDDPGNFDGIKDLAEVYRRENNLDATAPVPADAVTRSASGLDPDISPANAKLQAARVAKQRKLDVAMVQQLIDQHTRGRQLGVLGEPRVNVLEINRDLDRIAPQHEK